MQIKFQGSDCWSAGSHFFQEENDEKALYAQACDLQSGNSGFTGCLLFAILAPICLSVFYGFTDYSGMGSYQMIGMENYKQLLHDGTFWLSLRNSLFLAIGFICIHASSCAYSSGCTG